MFVSASGFAFKFRQTLFNAVQIFKNQFGVYGFQIPYRINFFFNVNYFRRFKTPHNFNNRRYVANMGKKLVTKPFALISATDQPGNIVKLNNRRNRFFGFAKFCQFIQPFIRNRNHAHIRVYGRERIIGNVNFLIC